jgi:hypothetical protein
MVEIRIATEAVTQRHPDVRLLRGDGYWPSPHLRRGLGLVLQPTRVRSTVSGVR